MSKVTGFTPLAHDVPPTKIPTGGPTVNGANTERAPPRRPSSTYSVFGTSGRTPDTEPAPPLYTTAWNGEESTADGMSTGQWSSAVGRATTGKSGRVIERIQAENDRLRRELKLEILHREEEQKKSEMARGQMQSLKSTNDNLVHMREQDRISLARKERKVEEIRSDLDSERLRRAEVEGQLKGLMRESERVEDELKLKLRDEVERAIRATSQYDVLSSSWRQMDSEYQRKIERLKKDLARLRSDSAEDRRKLDRLEITAEQQRQEVEKMSFAKDKMAREFEAFRTESQESTQGIRERAEVNERTTEEALEDTVQLLGQMRHVMNLKYAKDTA